MLDRDVRSQSHEAVEFVVLPKLNYPLGTFSWNYDLAEIT